MTALRAAALWLSPQDYLAGEELSQIRHEYVDGVVYAMSGGTQNHSLLAVEVVFQLRSQLPDRCRAFTSDMRLKLRINDAQRYYYPDVMVACGDRNPDRLAIEAPDLIIEVLSESTERIDRGEKFAAYITLPALAAYLLVDQARRHVEVFRRAKGWMPELYVEGAVDLPEIGASLDIASLYSRTDLARE